MAFRWKSKVPVESAGREYINGGRKEKKLDVLTKEVVWVEEVIVPDLHGEDGRQVPLSLSQTVEVILTFGINKKSHQPVQEIQMKVLQLLFPSCSRLFSTI